MCDAAAPATQVIKCIWNDRQFVRLLAHAFFLCSVYAIDWSVYARDNYVFM